MKVPKYRRKGWKLLMHYKGSRWIQNNLKELYKVQRRRIEHALWYGSAVIDGKSLLKDLLTGNKNTGL